MKSVLRAEAGGWLVAAAALAFTAPAAAGAQQAEAVAEAEGRTVVVEMVDFAFEPAKVTVRPGDVVRFVNTTRTPHNVEFRGVPDGARLGDEYVVPVEETGTRAGTSRALPPTRMGPYLLQKGETYEFVITESFAAGTYRYVCTPHEAMQMKGELEVQTPLADPAASDA